MDDFAPRCSAWAAGPRGARAPEGCGARAPEDPGILP